jgi:sugar O-acyltransferase (sialic acid O-acetyltransferase NeuD family)
MNDIVIVGAGGHARVLIDVLATRGVVPRGLIDPQVECGTIISNVEVLGDDSWLDGHRGKDLDIVVGIGSTGSVTARMNVFDSLRAKGFAIAGCIHSSVVIGSNCRIDITAQVLPGCVINNSATIDANVVLYTGSIVEHDCVVEEHAYLSPRVTLCGNVRVGARSFVGAGATVLPGVRIGANAVVAAGAVVTQDVADGQTVMGVPAKVVDSTQ